MNLRKLGSIRRSSEVIMIWDGPQIDDAGGFWSGSAYQTDKGMDGFQARYGHGFNYPVPAQSYYNTANYVNLVPFGTDTTRNTVTGQKADNHDVTPPSQFSTHVRLRHLNNTSGNFCFADGHVEARKAGDLRVRDFAVNRK